MKTQYSVTSTVLVILLTIISILSYVDAFRLPSQNKANIVDRNDESLYINARQQPRPRHNIARQWYGSLLQQRKIVTHDEKAISNRRAVMLSSSSSSSVANNSFMKQLLIQQPNIQKWMNRNFFVLGMIFTVLISYLFPSLGTTGGILHPEFWLNQYGVSYIFLLSGLSIQIEQMKVAMYNTKLNFLIQAILFFIWPILISIPTRFGSHLLSGRVISKPFLDSILILSCLPTTVNMCVILTSTVGGNVATALCNAVLSNILGILITPILLFRFFGSDIQLPFFDMVIKLLNKVLLPVVIGQILRAKVPSIKRWYNQNEKVLKRSQEIILLGILWNAFCTAITSQLGIGYKEGLVLLTVLPIMHIIALIGTFTFFSIPMLKLSRTEIIAAMFCSSQKTLAFGLPIIQTIFEGNTNVAMYCAPLMFLHPLQLLIGSMLFPKLEQYIQSDNHNNTKGKM